MPTLEIITIGTELLLGEITDTNSTYLARTLRDHGIDIYRIITIGDNPGRIASTVSEALKRAEIVITTGGLGPTVDDPTRQAVAEATGQPLIFKQHLWDQIQQRFKLYGVTPTENNRRQAFIPEGAIPIFNPVGTAPCFILEVKDSCVISLPGVPQEMETILHESVIPFLSNKFILKSQIIKATVLHAASMGESVIDETIADLEQKTNPTVGLLAHPGQVDIRITAKAASEYQAMNLIKPVEEELLRRLGENIFGKDEETLENVICQALNQRNLSFGVLEFGLDGSFISRVRLGQPDQIDTHILDSPPSGEEALEDILTSFRKSAQWDTGFGVSLIINEEIKVYLSYQDSQTHKSTTRAYGGPPGYAQLWAQNIGLDFLRRNLQNLSATGK